MSNPMHAARGLPGGGAAGPQPPTDPGRPKEEQHRPSVDYTNAMLAKVRGTCAGGGVVPVCGAGETGGVPS